MNRRFRALLLMLCVAVMFLSAAIISFRLAGRHTETENQAAPVTEPSGTVELFFSPQNGRWGARKATGRVLIEPQWTYLRTMSDTILIARGNDGRTDRYGLIRINGEPLMPFIYSNITYAGGSKPEIWIASFEENGKQHYHLYREDGSRWSDTAWDECRYENGTLYTAIGRDYWQGTPEQGGIRWTQWHTEYTVGLHQLVMDFDAAALQQLPPADTLMSLGETAAEFLCCLFVTHIPPDDSRISGEDNIDISVYQSCRLESAFVSRIRQLDTAGLPSYFVQIQAHYQRREADGSTSHITTAMELTITRNSAGAYTFGGFTDTQMNAAGGALIN